MSPPPLFHPSSRLLATAEFPQELDLRHTPGYPDVYSQGRLGSCTANAAVFALHYAMLRQGLDDTRWTLFDALRVHYYLSARLRLLDYPAGISGW
jgi:hypothetical protein